MRYVISSNASKLTLRAFAAGMMAALGHNPAFAVRKFAGEVAGSMMKVKDDVKLTFDIVARQ